MEKLSATLIYEETRSIEVKYRQYLADIKKGWTLDYAQQMNSQVFNGCRSWPYHNFDKAVVANGFGHRFSHLAKANGLGSRRRSPF